jgi:hypothetical protein
MRYEDEGGQKYHCAFFGSGIEWRREDIELGWLSGRGVLKDNQADVAVHLAVAADRENKEAARAFFAAPYKERMRICAVYELVYTGQDSRGLEEMFATAMTCLPLRCGANRA